MQATQATQSSEQKWLGKSKWAMNFVKTFLSDAARESYQASRLHVKHDWCNTRLFKESRTDALPALLGPETP